jgi:hypothetical protein
MLSLHRLGRAQCTTGFVVGRTGVEWSLGRVHAGAAAPAACMLSRSVHAADLRWQAVWSAGNVQRCKRWLQAVLRAADLELAATRFAAANNKCRREEEQGVVLYICLHRQGTNRYQLIKSRLPCRLGPRTRGWPASDTVCRGMYGLLSEPSLHCLCLCTTIHKS